MKRHWDEIYAEKPDEELSWFEPDPEPSLRLVTRACPEPPT